MSVARSARSAAVEQGIATAISLVVDRSRSMSPYVDKVVDSVYKFISEQKQTKGKATLSIAQFDDYFDSIFKNNDIKEVNIDLFKSEYHTRGGTAFRDAIVQAAGEMDSFINLTPRAAQPKRVVIALITDGEDNASHATVEKVRSLIKEKEEKGWDFMLLGAEEDTIRIAKDLGISEKKSALFIADKVDAGIGLLSQKVAQARGGKKIEITDNDRKLLLGRGNEL